MGVIDGNPVNAAYTNPKFLKVDDDDSKNSKLQLNDAGSGTVVTNVQKEINSIDNVLGKTHNGNTTDVPGFTNNQGFSSTDQVIPRVDSVSGKFHNSTGHGHTGNPGDAPSIVANTLSNVPLQGIFVQGTTLTSVTGSSKDVTSTLTGVPISTGPTVQGIVSTAPYNKVALRQASGTHAGDDFVDGSGNIVYGRLTNVTVTITLSFYVFIPGTGETVYSFGSAVDIDWFFQELFNPMGPTFPVYDPSLSVPSLNATADVIDASATQSGKVNTTTQSFAGDKTFLGNIIGKAKLAGDIATDSATTGTLASLPAPSKSILKVTNASLVSIGTITGGIDGQYFMLVNATGVSILLSDYIGSNGIYTGQGTDISLKNNGSVLLFFISALSSWFTVGTSSPSLLGHQDALGTGNGATTSFGPMSFSSLSQDDVLVFIDSNPQPKTAWSLSGGNTIVFVSAPAAGQKIYVYYGAPSSGGGGGPTAVTKFAAHKTASQNLPNTGPITVSFPTVDVDTATAYNSGTGAYTCPTTGYVSIAACIRISGGTDGGRYISIARNGVMEKTNGVTVATALDGTYCVQLAVYAVTAGDVITIQAAQDSTTNPITIYHQLYNTNDSAWFTIAYLP